MSSAPIFIVAPQPRTGTNLLWELVRRHPDCAPPRSPVWEDYFVLHLRDLARFTEAVHGEWDEAWGEMDHLKGELLHHLGRGITSFLTSTSERRLVTKTPFLGDFELFFDVFPHADLLLLLRDGRDVVASGMETFGWRLESGARSWARGVRRVMAFVEAHADERVRIVRFEELVRDQERTLIRLLEWLDLDPAEYPYDELARIPVKGSSRYRGDGDRDVHWEPLPRPHGFTPIARWSAWSSRDLECFERIAGVELALLGYDEAPAQSI